MKGQEKINGYMATMKFAFLHPQQIPKASGSSSYSQSSQTSEIVKNLDK